jgi:hypothetical protein
MGQIAEFAKPLEKISLPTSRCIFSQAEVPGRKFHFLIIKVRLAKKCKNCPRLRAAEHSAA